MKKCDLFKKVFVAALTLLAVSIVSIVEVRAGEPQIVITYIPPVGEHGFVEGKVIWDELTPENVDQYAIIAILIHRPWGDYPKPRYDYYLNPIDASGNFALNIIEAPLPYYNFYFVLKSTFDGVAGQSVNAAYMTGKYLGTPAIIDRNTIFSVQPPESNVHPGFVDAGTKITLRCQEGETIRYTLDGSDPAVSALIYNNDVFTVPSDNFLLIKAVTEKDGEYSYLASMLWMPRESYSTPLFGLNVSLALNGEHFGYNLSKAETEKRLTAVAPLTHWIRSFGTLNNGLQNINEIAKSMGLRTMIGVHITTNTSENDKQLEGLRQILQTGPPPDLISVGNETSLAGISYSVLIGCINSVRKMLKEFNLRIPVGSVDIEGAAWSQSLLNKLDYIGVNVYPATWSDVPEDRMLEALQTSYANQLAIFKSKCVMITETGTPYAGGTYTPPGFNSDVKQTPSEAKAAKYLREVKKWSYENSIPLFYFEAYDEPAKSTHPVEKYFGLMDGNRKIHPFYRDVLGISDDAALTHITVSAGTLSFDANTTSYTVNVANDITSISVTGAANHSQATVKGNVTGKQLEVGENVIEITVTAEDRVTVVVYTVTVVRAFSSDATLKSITLSAGTIPFDANITDYTVNVANNVESIDVAGTANHPAATVSGNLTGKTLEVGDNAVILTVAAEDGTTTKIYTVTIHRLSNDATLSSLALSAGDISFDANTTNYSVYLSKEISSIDIAGTANHPAATVSGNETGMTLKVGNNAANITVTAEDGTTKTYTVTVVRADHVFVTEAYLFDVTVNGNRITVAGNNIEYAAPCGKTSFLFDLHASPYSTVNVDNVKYSADSAGQIINLPVDIATNNILVTAETGGEENNYILNINAPLNDSMYYQRWDDVIAINLNPATNGRHNVSEIRWYTQDGTFVDDKGYITIQQGMTSDYYAEVRADGKLRRVCHDGITRSTDEIIAYPNPVSRGESLQLKLPDTFAGGILNIYGIKGSLVKSGLHLPATDNSVNVSDLDTGIYLLSVTGKESNRLVIKIIVE